MTRRDSYRAWRREFAAAVARNRRLIERGALTVDPYLSPAEAAQAACLTIREEAPYWFARDGRVRSWDEISRGSPSACAEAAAFATAVALEQGAAYVTLCIEEHPRIPRYAHVAVYIDGARADCYRDWALVVGSCVYRWRFDAEGGFTHAL